jgi:hypothetical protein
MDRAAEFWQSGESWVTLRLEDDQGDGVYHSGDGSIRSVMATVAETARQPVPECDGLPHDTRSRDYCHGFLDGRQMEDWFNREDRLAISTVCPRVQICIVQVHGQLLRGGRQVAWNRWMHTVLQRLPLATPWGEVERLRQGHERRAATGVRSEGNKRETERQT